MKVLIACEESQEVCKAFRDIGHEAYSNDILPCSGGYPEYHLQMDIYEAINYMDWDMGIAFTPCTYSCNSGVRWLKNPGGGLNEQRYSLTRKYAGMLRDFLNSSIPLKACENPIPHKYALEIIGRKYDQIIQPWMFGHGETKATCLWLEGLPKLIPTNIVSGREQRIWKIPPSPQRSTLRSKTFLGVAKAMAEQWG